MFSLHYSRKRGFYLFMGDRRVARLPLSCTLGDCLRLLSEVNGRAA